MILHTIAALIAALLALTGVSAEDETLSSGEVVNETCSPEDGFDENCQLENGTSTSPPSELPGPS